MSSTNLLIVHLSDLHIRTAEDAILKRAKQLAAATYSQLPQVENILIAFSGDIAWSGRLEEYTLAEQLLDEFVAEIRNEAPNMVPRRFVWNLTARIHRSGARWGLWATRQSELSTNPPGGAFC